MLWIIKKIALYKMELIFYLKKIARNNYVLCSHKLAVYLP